MEVIKYTIIIRKNSIEAMIRTDYYIPCRVYRFIRRCHARIQQYFHTKIIRIYTRD